MRTSKATYALLALLAVFALLSPSGVAVFAEPERPVPSNIRITPPAPVFSDKDRVAELMQRRERVAQRVGPQAFMILVSLDSGPNALARFACRALPQAL